MCISINNEEAFLMSLVFYDSLSCFLFPEQWTRYLRAMQHANTKSWNTGQWRKHLPQIQKNIVILWLKRTKLELDEHSWAVQAMFLYPFIHSFMLLTAGVYPNTYPRQVASPLQSIVIFPTSAAFLLCVQVRYCHVLHLFVFLFNQRRLCLYS